MDETDQLNFLAALSMG